MADERVADELVAANGESNTNDMTDNADGKQVVADELVAADDESNTNDMTDNADGRSNDNYGGIAAGAGGSADIIILLKEFKKQLQNSLETKCRADLLRKCTINRLEHLVVCEEERHLQLMARQAALKSRT